MRFTLRQLAYFVAAGEVGSVTLASERVNVSQPSISAAIAQLETEFGLQLFIRHHAQGLSLTAAGERFLQAAKALLLQAEELHNVADEVASAVGGPLQFGSFRTLSPLLVPDLCRGFLDRYPRVKLSATEGDEQSLLLSLRRAEISLALTYQLNVTPDIEFEPLAQLPTYILLPSGHPLASRRAIALAELAEEPFILLDLPLSREYFISLFMLHGLSPKIAARSDYPETVRSYVASGFGFSLLTARPVNKAALNGRLLSYVRLKGNHEPMVLGIATLRGVRKTRTAQAFVDYCRSVISTDALPGTAAWDE
ncbi:MAG: LysR family transcriptional regulator [Methylobacteriaceae bacterium]|nr:LysR family transcriptional regulator [Methylobacteriaceae bacterium]MBV9635074.1 LysR family transcriptional regulator [Methylobacteriaceae bacterium]MBV9702423.1 LysR family transcriptional regulator [Methylobacteriaceae bacterium]